MSTLLLAGAVVALVAMGSTTIVVSALVLRYLLSLEDV